MTGYTPPQAKKNQFCYDFMIADPRASRIKSMNKCLKSCQNVPT